MSTLAARLVVRPRHAIVRFAIASAGRVRALFALALDFATVAPSVTRVARRWRRDWPATVARSAVALTAVWAMVVGVPSLMSHRDVAGTSTWQAIPALVYLVSVGIAVDHYGARRGIAASFGLHVLGVLLFLPAMWRIDLANPNLGIEKGPGHMLLVFAGWPTMFLGQVLIAYAVAWLVPGSFPRQYRFAKAAWRALRTGDARERPSSAPDA